MEIEIDIPNSVVYAIVARIFGQEEIINRINSIRKSWGLKNFVAYPEFQDWLQKPHIDFHFTPEAADALNYIKERLEIDAMHGDMSVYEDYDKNKQLSKVRVIDFELEYSLHKFNLDLNLKQLFLKAIVCNQVRIEDFPTDKKVSTGIYSDWMFESLYYGHKNRLEALPDTRPNISRDREWYLLHKSGKSYLQIAKDAKDRGGIEPEDYRENVRKQIKRFERLLKGDI